MSKPIIGIRGFYGHGNCGDEAILKTLYQYAREKYEVYTFSDCNTITAKNYHYGKNGLALVSSTNRTALKKPAMDRFILGGGGLGAGLGWDLASFASLIKLKTIHIGTGVEHFDFSNQPFKEICKAFYESFSYTNVRDTKSSEILTRLGVKHEQSFDLALCLEKQECREARQLKVDKNTILLTIRQGGAMQNAFAMADNISKYAAENKMKLLLLPFSPHDVEPALQLSNDIPWVATDLYWYPEKIKFLTSQAGLVISDRRYHPLVFALSEKTNVLLIDSEKPEVRQNKCYQFMNDFNMTDMTLGFTEDYSAIKKKLDEALSRKLNSQFIDEAVSKVDSCLKIVMKDS